MNKTIIDPVSVSPDKEGVHPADAVCCPNDVSLVSEADRHTARDSSASGTGFLAGVSATAFSDDRTGCEPGPAGGADRVMASGAANAEILSQAASTVKDGTAARQGPEERELRRFCDDLHRTLPRGYSFDEETLCIYDEHATKVCAPLRVMSQARRPDGTGWTIEIEFLDNDLRLQRLSVSHKQLNDRPKSILSEFADRAFRIHYLSENFLAFLMGWQHVPRSWRAEHPGWFKDPDGQTCFLEPDGTRYAPACAEVEVFLAGPRRSHPGRAGSLEGWQAEIGRRAVGNPALIFAISAALAGPLLRLAGVQTAGFNFYGSGASGKSLLLHVAMSCIGHPERVIPWAAATTGLQRLSAEAQDGLLALDGYPLQPDGRQVKTLLALGNDAGFGRPVSESDPDGGQRWRRVILSSSEAPLAESLRSGKKAPPAPLLRRVIDLPADTAAHGLIEELHGAPDGAGFARSMEVALRRHHGHLLPAFLDYLLTDPDATAAELSRTLPALAQDVQERCARGPVLSPAAEPAGAERFALVGHAGELSIRYGLLPWAEGSAREAAMQMATLARHACSPTDWDRVRARAEVRRLIEDNRDRIVDLDTGPAASNGSDPIGWQDEGHVYLRTDVVRNDVEEVDDLLASLDGILVPGGEARSRQYRMPATKVPDRPRVYRFEKAGLG